MLRKNPVSAGPYILASSTFEQNRTLDGEFGITLVFSLRLETSNRMKSFSEGFELFKNHFPFRDKK